MLDVDQHPLAVDRVDLQTSDLPDAQARRIGGRQRHTIAQSCNRFEKAHDLVGTQNHGSFCGSRPVTMRSNASFWPERDAVEEPQGAGDLVDV